MENGRPIPGTGFDVVGSLSTGFTILAIALIIYGALGIYTSLFQRGGKEFDRGPVLVNPVLLVWGGTEEAPCTLPGEGKSVLWIKR